MSLERIGGAIIHQSWCILKLFQLCNHIFCSCYHFSMLHDFKRTWPIVFSCRISGIFLSGLWCHVSQRQMGFVCRLNLLLQSQISDLWRLKFNTFSKASTNPYYWWSIWPFLCKNTSHFALKSHKYTTLFFFFKARLTRFQSFRDTEMYDS